MTTKLCINCKHAKIEIPTRADLARCVNPAFARVSPVDGKTLHFAIEFATTQRLHGDCGMEAKFFEPVTP